MTFIGLFDADIDVILDVRKSLIKTGQDCLSHIKLTIAESSSGMKKHSKSLNILIHNTFCHNSHKYGKWQLMKSMPKSLP